MSSYNSLNTLFVCSSKACQKYLEKPVTLSCGVTVCKEHITIIGKRKRSNKYSSNNFEFNCDFCNIRHVLPKMLLINQIVSELIVRDVHLNNEQKDLKANITRLEALLSSHKNSPDEFIFDYFASVRNKIDLHREKSIETVHKRSDELIKELNAIEQRCKANLTKIKVPRFQTQDIAKYKNALRNPNLNLFEINEMIEALKSSVLNFQEEIKMFESKLTMNQIINFEANDRIDSFGKLDIKIDDGPPEATFQFVLNEFSKFKESQVERRSNRNCIVRNAKWTIHAKLNQLDNGDFDLGLSLHCKKDSSSSDVWSISAEIEFRILHIKDPEKNFVGSKNIYRI
jgi:hypothetical protein